MVGVSSIVAICITLAVTLFLPLVIYLVYGIKNKGKGVWTAWLIGAAGFFLPQVVVRLPIINLLSGSEDYRRFSLTQYRLYVFLLAFTAALFETAGRYAAAKLMGSRLTYERGVAAGLGHGGIESMVIVGMTYVNNLILTIMINTGSFDALVKQVGQTGGDAASLELTELVLTETAASSYYMAGYERILTMVFHLALSLLMCYCVHQKKDFMGIGLCLVIHCGVDYTVPMIINLANKKISFETMQIVAYLFLTVVTAISIAGIRHLRKLWKRESIQCAGGNM